MRFHSRVCVFTRRVGYFQLRNRGVGRANKNSQIVDRGSTKWELTVSKSKVLGFELHKISVQRFFYRFTLASGGGSGGSRINFVSA